MDNKVRVRFAPSPTGPLHIGGVRTALYNYLFAKKHNGSFLLRIEDTDQQRLVKGAEDYILKSLKWCGITPDEGVQIGGEKGPYKQSLRKEKGIYQPYVQQLIDSGHAYLAFDTSEELDQMRELAKKSKIPNWQYNNITRLSMRNSLSLSKEEVEKLLAENHPYTVRIKMPRNEDIRFYDEIRGWIIVNTNNLDDKVICKSDGMPTYHLANVVDDHLMEISHVIRGEEWLPSAPLHILLYRFLGWEEVQPKFAHLPLILKPDGAGKLSKRDGDRLGFPVFPLQWNDPTSNETSSGYKEEGYLPEAFVNMLCFLGWNPSTEQELFSMNEMIEAFSLERVGKAGAKFDLNKTKWFNQQYLRALDNTVICHSLKTELENKDISNAFSDEQLQAIVELLKERATYISDFWKEGQYFFVDNFEYDQKVFRKKWKENTPEILNNLKTELANLQTFTKENIETLFQDFLAKNDLSFGQVGPCFRLVLTGLGTGPSLFDIASILGKQAVLKRFENGLNALK